MLTYMVNAFCGDSDAIWQCKLEAVLKGKPRTNAVLYTNYEN